MKKFLLTIIITLCLVLGPAGATESDQLQTALREAREFTRNGEFVKALEKLAWYHENSRNTGHTGVRLSFAMNDWKALADQYPPAKEKIIGLRNDAEQAVLAKRGGFTEFSEIVSIDRTFEQEEKSYQLFLKLAEESPETARKCFFAVRDLLVKRKEYALYLKLGPDADRQYLNWENIWKNDALRAGKNPDMDQALRNLHLNNIRQLIEVLVGGGQFDKAAEIQRKAVELTKDKSLESAVEDAKKNVQERP